MMMRRKRTFSKKSQRSRAIREGYRSGFEGSISDFLKSEGKEFTYEEEVIEYTQPEKKRKYTPDFVIVKRDGSKMFIETKGRWLSDDRIKHKLIKQQKPDLDIRLVFQNPNCKIRKGSKTSYKIYCDKNDLKYSPLKGKIPKEWLDE